MAPQVSCQNTSPGELDMLPQEQQIISVQQSRFCRLAFSEHFAAGEMSKVLGYGDICIQAKIVKIIGVLVWDILCLPSHPSLSNEFIRSAAWIA